MNDDGDRGRYRSKKPSAPDVWSEITERHRVESDPPMARWIDRRVGRAIRLGLRWWIRTKTGTALTAVLSALAAWASEHLWHWMHLLWP